MNEQRFVVSDILWQRLEPHLPGKVSDGTIVQGHQKATGAKRGPQATGCSRGSLIPEIVALVEAPGNLVRFLLLPGQSHDMKGVAPLIRGVSFDALLADKAFDADWLLQEHDQRGATAVIPLKTNGKIQRDDDAEGCKWRHLVSNDFAKIKAFRRIATRYDRTDCSPPPDAQSQAAGRAMATRWPTPKASVQNRSSKRSR